MDEGEQSEAWPYLGAFEDVTLAQALGISEKAFDHRIDQVRYRLTELRKRAIARRPPTADRRRTAMSDSSPGRGGGSSCASTRRLSRSASKSSGSVSRGRGERPTPDMANSHPRREWADSGIATAGLGVAGGGGVGYLLPAAVFESSPWLGAGGAVLDPGIAGAGGFSFPSAGAGYRAAPG